MTKEQLRKNWRRGFAVALTAAMVANSTLPSAAFAAEFIAPDAEEEEISLQDDTQTEESFSSLSTEQAACFIKKSLVYCPLCMEKHGFHSYYHQISRIKKCPWHPHISLVKDPNRLYLVKTGRADYAYGYTDPEKITEKSPCFTTDKLPELMLPKFPYKHVYLCGAQEEYRAS